MVAVRPFYLCFYSVRLITISLLPIVTIDTQQCKQNKSNIIYNGNPDNYLSFASDHSQVKITCTMQLISTSKIWTLQN